MTEETDKRVTTNYEDVLKMRHQLLGGGRIYSNTEEEGRLLYL